VLHVVESLISVSTSQMVSGVGYTAAVAGIAPYRGHIMRSVFVLIVRRGGS